MSSSASPSAHDLIPPSHTIMESEDSLPADLSTSSVPKVISSPRRPAIEAAERTSTPTRGRNLSASVDIPPPASSTDTSFTVSSLLHSTNGSHRSKTMPSDELLATIVEMKLAGHSKDKGTTREATKGNKTSLSLDTLDLCHKKLQDIPEEMIDIIRDEVVRLALAYNYIYTLPVNFSSLTRLRYLNIRGNLISSFPETLTQIPALEILDISRNKIRKLPSDPCQLLNLRVLCISHNRLRRLPTWMISMRHLRILKIDDNPIQWPPPHISILPPLSDGAPLAESTPTGSPPNEKGKNKAPERAMQLWIVRMKRWMKENAALENERIKQKALQRVAEAEADGPLARGHTRGTSSTASVSSALGHSTIRPSSPNSGQTGSLSESIQPGETNSKSPNTTVESSSMKTLGQQEDLADFDSSTSMVSPATPAGTSPERSFRMRPLVLTRAVGGKSSPMAMTGGSSSGIISPVTDPDSSIAGPSRSFSSSAALEALASGMKRTQSRDQFNLVSSTAHPALSTPQGTPPQLSKSKKEGYSSATSISSVYSVESENTDVPQTEVAKEALQSLSPNDHSSPTRSVTPTPHETSQSGDPTTPMPASSMTTTVPAARPTPSRTLADALASCDPDTVAIAHPPAKMQAASSYLADVRPSAAPLPRPPSSSHGRTQSHSSGQRKGAASFGSDTATSARSKVLSSKKSLPDLRIGRIATSNLGKEISLPMSTSSSSNDVPSLRSGTGVESSVGTTLASSRRRRSLSLNPSSELAVPTAVSKRWGAVPFDLDAMPPEMPDLFPSVNLNRTVMLDTSRPPSVTPADPPQQQVDDPNPPTMTSAVSSVDLRTSIGRSVLPDHTEVSSKELVASPSIPRTPNKPSSRDSSQQQHERDSYFKRLSTFPSTLIPPSCPPRVLKVIDASRGILFALSQIFTALKQYILFCTDERISAQIQRVLEVAAGTLDALIDSLDRFDSLALKGQNSASSVGAVVEASRDSVLTFRQVISVVQLQLSFLLRSADLRYTRSLMFMLYGAMVEVSTSWKEFSNHEEVNEAIEYSGHSQVRGYTPPSNSGAAPASGSLHASHLPSIAENVSPQSAKSLQDDSTSPSQPTIGQARVQRERQGGSFGAQDAQIGTGVAAIEATTSGASSAFSNGQSGTPYSNELWVPESPSRKRGGSSRRDGMVTGSSAFTGTHNLSLSTQDLHPHRYDQDGQIMMLPPPPAGMSASAPAGSTTFAIAPHAAQASGRIPGSGEFDFRRAPATTDLGKDHSAVPAPPKIDHHLLSLIQQVTSTASGVWITLFEHLASLGIRGHAVSSATGGVFSPDTTPILGPNRISGGIRSASARTQLSSSSGASNAAEGDLLKPSRDERTMRSVSPSPSVTNSAGASTAAPHPHSQSARKLNALRDQCLFAAELTKRLQHTLEKVQDVVDSQSPVMTNGPGQRDSDMGGLSSSKSLALTPVLSPSEARRLVDESIAFVAAVTSLLIQIKALSLSHDTLTAPELRKVLGALTTGCTNLGVHLHFCAPRGGGMVPSTDLRRYAGEEESKRGVGQAGSINDTPFERNGAGTGGIDPPPPPPQQQQQQHTTHGHVASRSASSAASMQQQHQLQRAQKQIPGLPART